jgi:hypothetical protein
MGGLLIFTLGEFPMMRPDEQANAAEVQRDQRMRSNVGKGVGVAVGAASAAFGARALPFLSEYIPTDLAMKGLQRVAPKVADFLKKGQSAGLDIKQGMDFIKSKLSTEQTTKSAQDNRNLIEKYSPELHQFIDQQIKGGRSHLEAGAIAQLGKKGGPDFKSIIDKITKDNKSTWADVLDAVYGNSSQSAKQPANSPQTPGNSAQSPINSPQSGINPPQTHPNSAQGQQAARQSGPGQQALMDILSKINQKLGQ